MPPAVQHKLWGYKTVARQLPHGVLQKAVDADRSQRCGSVEEGSSRR